MDGLEAVEMRLSELTNENPTIRLDSEYFKKQYLHEDEKRKHYKNKQIGEIAFVTDGQHGYHEIDEESNIRLLTAKNAKNWFADLIDADKVAKWVDDNNKRSSLQANDIILSTRGTVGFCAIVKEEILPAQIDQDVARIYIKEENLLPEFLLTYLNCAYGQDWMKRNQTGMVQQGLPLHRVREFPVPFLTSKFQSEIQTLINSLYLKNKQSEYSYKESESVLLNELGLHNWQPTEANTEVKSFKDSFLQSGRLDAEYYQPKYDDLIHRLSNFESIRIKNFITYPVSSGSTPKANDERFYTDKENGIPFIRAVDIIQSRVSIEDNNYITKAIHNGDLKKTQLKQNDVLFSIAGTVGRCGIWEYSIEANINQACAILRFDETIINRLYLITFFNSPIGKLLVEKYARQGLQTNLNLEEVSNLFIPVIEKNKQEEIAQFVQQSFHFKKQSQQLLEAAKQAVEIAIEEGEEKAMEFIKEKLPKE